ncbi:MAG: hypothetical protein R3A12_04090 [Ignavibacteria bacterium]
MSLSSQTDALVNNIATYESNIKTNELDMRIKESNLKTLKKSLTRWIRNFMILFRHRSINLI